MRLELMDVHEWPRQYSLSNLIRLRDTVLWRRAFVFVRKFQRASVVWNGSASPHA